MTIELIDLDVGIDAAARPYRNRKPRWRKALRAAMRAEGRPMPLRQWVWCVEVTGLAEVPAWAREAEVSGIAGAKRAAWLWPVDARKLAAEDRRAGGRPRMFRTEIRYCGECERPWVGADAERVRRLEAAGLRGCGETCAHNAQTGVWRRLRRRCGKR